MSVTDKNPFNALEDKSSLRLKQPEQTRTKELSFIDGAMQSTGARIQWAAGKTKESFDKVVTPEQQRALNQRYQSFAQSNPKLAAFLLVNLIFSGVPIAIFTIFSISVFAFSLITGLILGLIGALLFTSSVVGIALVFLVPTVIFTTVVASTIFFWAVLGLFLYTQYEQRSRR